MNAYPPTHEDVARRAYEYWQQQGSPIGRDQEIWFEAERQLSTEATALKSSLPGAEWRTAQPKRNDTAAVSAPSAEDAIHPLAQAKIAQQKKEARSPQVPAKSAPKPAPVESGKPLWDRPHSR
jgi:hypothetical protein